MKIKFGRRKPAPEPVTPVDVFLHSAADRVGPLAQSAADRVGPLAQAAADRMGAAADRVRPLAHSATDRVGPYAQQVTDRIGPLAQHAYIFVEPYAHQAADRVGPLATTAKQRGAQAAQDAVERFGPRLDEALDRVAPAVEAAQKKMHDELLPKLTEVLTAAATTPAVVEATKRSKATVAAARGELQLPEPEPEHTKGRWVRRLAVVAAIGGVAVLAARKFLGSKDADWQAAKPGMPYAAPRPTTPTTDTAPTDTVPTAAASAASTNGQVDLTAEDADAGTATDQALDDAKGTFAVDDAGDVTAELNDAGIEPVFDSSSQEIEFPDDLSSQGGELSTSSDEVVDVEDGTAPAADRTKYTGGGVYVGVEPPEGFSIKGNERSMKYHLPESAGYATTISEVWFDSEEAAQEAGFIRAQR